MFVCVSVCMIVCPSPTPTTKKVFCFACTLYKVKNEMDKINNHVTHKKYSSRHEKPKTNNKTNTQTSVKTVANLEFETIYGVATSPHQMVSESTFFCFEILQKGFRTERKGSTSLFGLQNFSSSLFLIR